MDNKKIQSFAIDIISEFNPRVASIKTTFDKICSISDRIFLKKLMRLFSGQMNDMESQVELAIAFRRESPNYQTNMQRLLYAINSINSDDKIDILSNLMRSLSLNLIELKMFWRLVDIVDKMYYDDIVEFAKIVIDKEPLKKYSNPYLLREYSLAICSNDFTWASVQGEKEYSITKTGIELVRCGYDLDHYDSYKKIE